MYITFRLLARSDGPRGYEILDAIPVNQDSHDLIALGVFPVDCRNTRYTKTGVKQKMARTRMRDSEIGAEHASGTHRRGETGEEVHDVRERSDPVLVGVPHYSPGIRE